MNPIRDRDWDHYDEWEVIYAHIKCDRFDNKDDTGESHSWGEGCFIVK